MKTVRPHPQKQISSGAQILFVFKLTYYIGKLEMSVLIIIITANDFFYNVFNFQEQQEGVQAAYI